MRITFVLPDYPRQPSGGFRVVYEYANHLAGRGCAVAVVHPARRPLDGIRPYSAYRRLRSRGHHLRNLLSRPGVRWQHVDPRVRLLFVPDLSARHVPDADAVFATWWTTADALLGYPASKGGKCYLLQHYESWGGPSHRVDATWRAPLEKIVIARWLYEKGLALGVPAETMTYIPNGINHTLFRQTRPLASRPPRVAMLYSALEWKGAREGLEALRIAKAAEPRLEAVLFGVARRPKRLAPWIEYVRDPSRSTLVERVYNGSAVYLCPSHAEGWHLPPAEAMACGCAVVSTDIDGVRDYARDGETALLSLPRDASALAANLLRLLREDVLRVRLAAAGHAWIQRFEWEQSTDLFMRFLAERVRGAVPANAARAAGPMPGRVPVAEGNGA